MPSIQTVAGKGSGVAVAVGVGGGVKVGGRVEAAVAVAGSGVGDGSVAGGIFVGKEKASMVTCGISAAITAVGKAVGSGVVTISNRAGGRRKRTSPGRAATTVGNASRPTTPEDKAKMSSNRATLTRMLI